MLAIMLLAGCVAGTNNVGSPPYIDNPPVPRAYFVADFNLAENGGWAYGLTATLTVEWQMGHSLFLDAPGQGPYTIEADMGGGTTEDIPAGTPAESPFVHQFTLAESGTYTYVVTVVDTSIGAPGTYAGTYAIKRPPNNPPVIDALAYQGGRLSVKASDPDGDELTVSLAEPRGLRVDALSKTIDAQTGEAVFYWSAVDPFSSVTGVTTITADDGRGGIASESIEISIYYYSLVGALVAVPAATEVTTADKVMVVVVCGPFTHPFKYANSVVVTVDQGASYVPDSFNAGAPGGERFEPDGLWANMDPTTTDFLAAHYSGFTQDWLPETIELAFTAIPLGGNNTVDGGALFNFQLEFSQPGTYTLGFLDTPEVRRTYYSDMDGNEYSWDDISNDYPGVPNSIEVT